MLVWSSTYSRSCLSNTWTYPLFGYETLHDQHRPLHARPRHDGVRRTRRQRPSNHMPEGTVVGRIDACSGLGSASRGTWVAPCWPSRSGPPVQTSAAIGKLRLAADVVARQEVPVGGQFHFRLADMSSISPTTSGGTWGFRPVFRSTAVEFSTPTCRTCADRSGRPTRRSRSTDVENPTGTLRREQPVHVASVLGPRPCWGSAPSIAAHTASIDFRRAVSLRP